MLTFLLFSLETISEQENSGTMRHANATAASLAASASVKARPLCVSGGKWKSGKTYYSSVVIKNSFLFVNKIFFYFYQA